MFFPLISWLFILILKRCSSKADRDNAKDLEVKQKAEVTGRN